MQLHGGSLELNDRYRGEPVVWILHVVSDVYVMCMCCVSVVSEYMVMCVGIMLVGLHVYENVMQCVYVCAYGVAWIWVWCGYWRVWGEGTSKKKGVKIFQYSTPPNPSLYYK